jgi:hypothetical protein
MLYSLELPVLQMKQLIQITGPASALVGETMPLPLPPPASTMALPYPISRSGYTLLKRTDDEDEALDFDPLLYADQDDDAKLTPSRTRMLFVTRQHPLVVATAAP